MGCGVAALAGISCDQIGTAIQVLLLLFAVAVLIVVGYASKREKLLRNESIALAILVSPFVWAHFSGANRLAVIKAQMQEFQSVCYGKAFELIHRRAENLKALVLSPKSNIMGAWEFELFFGKTRPKKWGGMPVVASPTAIDLVGAYEMRYTYLPEERAILDTPTLFRGVRQEIFDLRKKELIAERVNYLWGEDFNRSGTCFTGAGLSPWFDGNDDFADRVLGYRYAEPGVTREVRRGPEWRIKATLVSEQDADVDLHPINERWVTIDGFRYDVNGGSASLADPQSGKNHALADYLKDTPYGYNSMAEFEGHYVLTFFSAGTLRNRPPHEVLMLFLTKEGKELKRIYAQIPPVIEWMNGWGFSPGDVYVSKTDIRLQLYGKKKRTGEYSDQPNEGHYFKRYMLNIPIPADAQ